MKVLDSREEIAKIDKINVLGSVEALPDQCLHACEDASQIDVPQDYQKIKAVVMCGMGGSGLGARVIESVFADEIKIPLVVVHDYNLPKWVDCETLVICSSYSGETEETLNNTRQAIAAGAKWMAIGAGNTLIKMAQEHRVPYYQIYPKYNPSNQPRMAIGYSIVGQLILAAKAGLINFNKKDIDEIVSTMRQTIERIKVEIQEKNEAKKLAVRMKDKIITFISSGHLVGATHVVNNQLNENGKVFSFDFQIPELNHHLMEGLSHPEVNKTGLFTIFVNSSLYPERIQKRFSLTKDVVEKQDVETYEFKSKGGSKLARAFEFIQFGAFVNLYLSILYKQNPGPVPWVDYFKTRLGQPLGK